MNAITRGYAAESAYNQDIFDLIFYLWKKGVLA
jgi:hypothetical protein